MDGLRKRFHGAEGPGDGFPASPSLAGNAIKLSGRTFLAPPKGEARRYVANDFLNLIAFPSRGRCPEGADRVLAV